MIKLFFLRHGQTDYNLNGIVQGGGIDSDLNETGRIQAKAAYQHYAHIRFDHVYASPLKRTHQTLAPWLEKGYQFQIEAGLKEFNWGIHEGKKPTKAQHEQFLKILKSWREGEYSASVEAGETLNQAWSRAVNFFETIPFKHANQQILLCSHGRQLRILFCKILKIDFKEMERFSHSNTGMSIIEWHPDGQRKLIQLNDTRHLQSISP